jgi:hypothetical protein
MLAAGILYAWAYSHSTPAAGMLVALVFGLSPLLHLTIGSEMCTYLALVLAGLFACRRSCLTLGAILLAFAAILRPEGLVAGIVLAVSLWLRQRPIAWRPVAIYAGLVAVYYLGLWLYFGSPVPVTLLAKQQQSRVDASIPFWARFLSLVHAHARQPLYWLHGALAALGAVQVRRVARHWAVLLAWSLMSFLLFTDLLVTGYLWYYAPLVPAFAVLVAEGMRALSNGLVRIRLPHALQAVTLVVLIAGLLVPLLADDLSLAWRPDPRTPVYEEIGRWIADHSLPNATVGALEVGIIGYYAQRRVVDFGGLIQPEVARHLGLSGSYAETAAWAIGQQRPDYVALDPKAFSDLVGSDWFADAYAPIRTFDNHQTRSMTLYERGEAP